MAFTFADAGVRYVGRTWIEGGAVYALVQTCSASEAVCFEENQKHVQALSGAMAGTPENVADDDLTRSIPVALLSVWLLFVGPWRLVSRIRRQRHDTRSGELFVNVQPEIERIRRRRGAKRVGAFVGLAAAVLFVAGALGGESETPLGLAAIASVACAAGLLWLWARRGGKGVHLHRDSSRDVLGAKGLSGISALSASRAAVATMGVLMLPLLLASLMPVHSTETLALEYTTASQSDDMTGFWRFAALAFMLSYQVDPSLLLVFGFLVPLIAVGSVERLGQRLTAPSAHAALEADSRPPVLYLRSFDEDKIRLPATWSRRGIIGRLSPLRRRRFEELLATLLDAAGPVVAISPPGTRLAPLGAARVTLNNDEWQSQVEQWASRSQAIVIGATPGEIREGFQWELDLIRTHLQQRPILLVVAPHRKKEMERRFGNFLRLNWSWASPLGAVPNGVLIACHLPGSGWQAFGANHRTDAAYAVAMYRCLEWVKDQSVLGQT